MTGGFTGGYADRAWNPWTGCSPVSAGCDHCSGAEWAARFASRPWERRRQSSQATWDKPLRWNSAAARRGIRETITLNLCDPFDEIAMPEWRRRFWLMVRRCTALDWLLLTRRPAEAPAMLPRDFILGYEHVLIGASVEDQAAADILLPALLDIPADRRVIACMPLLGPIDLSAWLPHFDCVIAAGEHGPDARPADPDWFRSVRDQCAAANVPFHFDAWGTWHPACCVESADTRVYDAAPEISIDRYCVVGATLMERGGRAENGRTLDGTVYGETLPRKADAACTE